MCTLQIRIGQDAVGRLCKHGWCGCSWYTPVVYVSSTRPRLWFGSSTAWPANLDLHPHSAEMNHRQKTFTIHIQYTPVISPAGSNKVPVSLIQNERCMKIAKE